MLPNLGKLSLHDEAETGGFYVPSDAEQANMNDDPVTLEKPVYTMSFRVRLPQDNADGSPRYKFFAPREERRGAQRASDKLISWRFWLKGTRDEVRISHALGFMRTRFGEYMHASPALFNIADNWSSRLLLSVGERVLQPRTDQGAGEPALTLPVLYVDCHVFVPAPHAQTVYEFLIGEMLNPYGFIHYGVGSAMRRMFGVIGAWSRGPADPADGVRNRGSWRDLPAELTISQQNLVEPSMTVREYAAWHDWATDEEPVRIVPGLRGPQAETDWAVEWRFWLKGELPAQHQSMHYRMLEWFRLYMRSFNNGSYDYSKRVHLDLAQRRLRLLGETVFTEPAWAIQVDVQLYMPSRMFADDFVRRVDYLRNPVNNRAFSYESAMRRLFGIDGAMEWLHSDQPTVRDNPNGRVSRSMRMGPYPAEHAAAPVLSQEQYDTWATFSHLPPNEDQLVAMDREVRAGGETRVRWRFWLKGEMTPEERLTSAIWMRRAFQKYMVQNPIPRRFYTGVGSFNDDMRWFRRTRAIIIQDSQTITNDQGSTYVVRPLRCEFEIYFDRQRANAFVQWVSSTIGTGSWESLAEDWVGFVPIRAWDGWDRPQQLDNEDPHDDTHDLMTEVPTDTVNAWNQWGGWRRVHRAAE